VGSRKELSRRERQIMACVYRLGQASVAEVLAEIPDPPSYSAVRATMQILVRKDYLSCRQAGPRYVYQPTTSRQTAARQALRRMIDTFFDNSVERAMTAMLKISEAQLSDEELDRLGQLIDETRRRKEPP
jgi:predicted transcriptional regulator